MELTNFLALIKVGACKRGVGGRFIRGFMVREDIKRRN